MLIYDKCTRQIFYQFEVEVDDEDEDVDDEVVDELDELYIAASLPQSFVVIQL